MTEFCENMNLNFYFGVFAGGNKIISEDVCKAFSLKTHFCDLMIQIVLDGHGENGAVIPRVAIEIIETSLKEFVHTNINSFFSPEDMKKFLIVLIKTKCNEEIKNYLKKNLPNIYFDEYGVPRNKFGMFISGGSTCTISVILHYQNKNRYIVTCNVGDSPSIVIFENGTYEILTTNHNASNPDEQTRIKKDAILSPLKIIYENVKVREKYLLEEIDHKEDHCPPLCDKFSQQSLLSTKYTKSTDSLNPDDIKNSQDKCGNIEKIIARLYEIEPECMTFKLTDRKIWCKDHPKINPSNVRLEPAYYAVSTEDTNDNVCIANTRGLGDFNSVPFGFSHEPSSNIFTLLPDDHRKVIVCSFSDGISDLIFYDLFCQKLITTIDKLGLQKAGDFILELHRLIGVEIYDALHFDDACICISISTNTQISSVSNTAK